MKLELIRQKKDKHSGSSIIDYYKNLKNRLSHQKELLFNCSTLRILFNAGMNFEIIMDEIYKNLEEYFTLEMPNRYLSLKEIGIPIKNINFPYCHKYALISKKIGLYMKTQAIVDIDNYITTLQDYEIIERCRMEKEKVAIAKEYIEIYDFNNIYTDMVNIKDIYINNEMVIDSLITDLDIADECMSHQNYEKGVMKKIPLEKMKEHVKFAEQKISMLKKYPIVAECNLRLSRYYFELKEESKAKKCLEEFEHANIDISNYAYWLQGYYTFLKYKITV